MSSPAILTNAEDVDLLATELERGLVAIVANLEPAAVEGVNAAGIEAVHELIAGLQRTAFVADQLRRQEHEARASHAAALRRAG